MDIHIDVITLCCTNNIILLLQYEHTLKFTCCFFHQRVVDREDNSRVVVKDGMLTGVNKLVNSPVIVKGVVAPLKTTV